MAQDDVQSPLLSPDTPNASVNDTGRVMQVSCATSSTFMLQQQALSLKTVSIMLVGYLGVGTVTFFLIRSQIAGKKTNGFIDSLYFCVVTMTTVGFGDLVPRSTLAKLIACVYVFAGMTIVGLFLGRAADKILENQEALLVRAVNTNGNFVPSKVAKDIQGHELKYKFVMAVLTLVMLAVVGTTVISHIENRGVIDAFYCVCCTITTLGYGDESFSTKSGRGFAVIWMLSSTICLAQCFCYITELHAERRQQELVKWVTSRKLTSADLEAADLDNDEVVSAAEFIVYKLTEMGKISQNDIATIMECFRNLDADHSGTLTAEDLKLLESS